MDAVETNQDEAQLGGQMSFLEHLDELRRRIINSVIIIVIAFLVCFYFSGEIYNFLSIPVTRALAEAQRTEFPIQGLTGEEKIISWNNLKEGEKGRFVFDRNTDFGGTVVIMGTSVNSLVAKDKDGNLGLFTEEPIYTSNAIIPKGIRLPLDFNFPTKATKKADEKLIVTTAMQPFTLYVTVSLYAAIALSLPLLLLQIWGFIAPALYQHERRYVTPFVLLSSISFVVGAAFGYYILFPPAVKYLLGVGADFNLMLNASDYFDFITILMLAMGLVFQMPAISYVLARVGVINAGLLVRGWKIALVVILIVAAVASPTPDALNMMLFALPMIFLYVISVFVAWFFGKKRTTTEV
ncbi:MAG TPA: twin-arginine translocase subunit TatC [Pyrinomonadaceae bacterium]|nr:twin-arginine translocase subunit TatC [Pyrinomonadaceae bacterium]